MEGVRDLQEIIMKEEVKRKRSWMQLTIGINWTLQHLKVVRAQFDDQVTMVTTYSSRNAKNI